MMKFKKFLAFGVSAALAAAALCSCGAGADESEPTATSDETISVSSEAKEALSSGYDNYIESYTSEVGEFVYGDLDTILGGVAGLNASNFDEWKTVYENGCENIEHWYNELVAAEMLCSDDKLEAHQTLEQTVATIYQLLDGLTARVEAAEGGDFSQLEEKSEQYTNANEIIQEMWERTLLELE